MTSSTSGRLIVGLTGAAGAGKTTLAKHLVDHHGFTRTRFAEPLKAMLRVMGLTAEQVDGAEKEAPADLLEGATPRYAMQTLGTEWGRVLIGPDLWVKAWTQLVGSIIGPVVVDDVRFENEVEMIRRLGGTVVRIDRPGTWGGDAHISEAGIGSLDVDWTYENAAPIEVAGEHFANEMSAWAGSLPGPSRTPEPVAARLDAAWADVRAFHRAMGQPAPAFPTLQTSEQVARRIDWLNEEVGELASAFSLVDQADAYIDILYFALGGLVELGVRPAPLFDIVQAANMAKLWDDGKPRFREDGKIIKPAAWQAPEPKLAAEIERQAANEPDLCGICQEPMVEGQPAITDINMGDVHAACCGPEREGYVNLETGEPLGPDDPLPAPHPYRGGR